MSAVGIGYAWGRALGHTVPGTRNAYYHVRWHPLPRFLLPIEGFHSVMKRHHNCYEFVVHHVGVHAVLWHVKSCRASRLILTHWMRCTLRYSYWVKLWCPGSLCEIWSTKRRLPAKALSTDSTPLLGCHPLCTSCGIVRGSYASIQDLRHSSRLAFYDDVIRLRQNAVCLLLLEANTLRYLDRFTKICLLVPSAFGCL